MTTSGGNGGFFLLESADDQNGAEFGAAVTGVAGVARRNTPAGPPWICTQSAFPPRLHRCDWIDVGRILVPRADEGDWKEDARDVSVQLDEEERRDDACVSGGMWDVARDAAKEKVERR